MKQLTTILLLGLGAAASAADPIKVPAPKGAAMAYLGDPDKPVPVIGSAPVTSSVVLPRGVYNVTARLRFNGKTKGFEDYLDMPIRLTLDGLGKPAEAAAPVRDLARTGVLTLRVENGEPVKVTLYCYERIEVPWLTPAAVEKAFGMRMKRVKAKMKWAAEGKEFPDTEVDEVPLTDELEDEDFELDAKPKKGPVDATKAKYPMLLLEGFAVDFVEELPEGREAEPYRIVVEAPNVLPDGPGSFAAKVAIERTAPVGPAAASLLATLTDRRGRVFWQHEAELRFEGKNATVALPGAHPDLPAGQYLLNCSLKDAAGKVVTELPDVVEAITEYFAPGTMARAFKPLPTGAVRRPIARMQSYMDLGRELLWGLWELSSGDIHNPGYAKVGLNTGSYQYPYRWAVNFSDWGTFGGWPEGNPVAASKAPTGPMDPGFVVIDEWDERGMLQWTDAETLRKDRLRFCRTPRAWPAPMPTISEYNRRSGNDCLGWDEVERGGFPGHGKAQGDVNGVGHALIYDNICARIEAGRLVNPNANHSTGMGAGCDQHLFDSMHNRVYGHSGTVEMYAHLVQAVPRYGLRPWTYLVNPTSDRPEHVRRIMWISVAVNGRCMPFFELGPRLVVADGPRKGELTPQGQWARETIARLQPLSPILMSVRNRLNPEVLFWDPAYYLPNDGVLEGLLANGVQPEVYNAIGARALRANGVQPEAGRKLIILHGSSLGGQDFTPVRRAVEAGACLFMTAQADNGAFGPKVFGLTLTGLNDMVLDEGATSLPKDYKQVVTRRVDKPEQDLDLSPLGEFIPGFSGLTIRAKPGPLGELAADSPLKRILSKDRTTLAYAGQVGKGKVVILNAHLPGPGQPPHQARNRAEHGALMGAVLKWAGVQGEFRCTDPGSDRISQEALAIELATRDQAQSYAIVVPEYNANLAFRPSDPGVRAVRDLCAGTNLPWKQDAHGRYVEIKLEVGNGTLLSLVKSDPSAAFAVTPAVLGEAIPAKQVTGGQTLYLGVSRQAGGAAIQDAHTFQVSARGPDGKAIPGFTEWGTGPGPVVIKLPVAVDDPDGAWTIEVRDLTDGAVGTATIEKRKGYQPDKTGANPASLAAALGVRPVPYVLEMESVPRIEGDVIVATVRGKLRSTVEGEQDAVVTIGAPDEYLLNGTNRIPLRVKGGQATPFEATFCMHRDQFLTVYNGVDYARDVAQAGLGRRVNDEGIRVRAEIAGKTVARAKWLTDISRWLRKPAGRTGSLSGGEYAFLVENLSGKDCQVELACEGRPGWDKGRLSVNLRVASGERAEVRQKVTWADSSKADPGYHWLPLGVKVDGREFAGHTLFVEEIFEQAWWVRHQGLKLSESLTDDEGDDDLLTALSGPSAKLPADPKQAAAAGWKRLDTQGVLWGTALISKVFGGSATGAGSILAAAYVSAPTERDVKVGFLGPKPPSRIWVNDALVPGAWRGMKGGGAGPKPATLRKGVDVVVMEIPLPLTLYRPSPWITSHFLADGLALVLQDPKTGKRDRELIVGAR